MQGAQVLAVRAMAGAQVVEQQVMQAEPVALGVERHEEVLEAALVEQAAPGVRAAGDFGDERGIQRVEDRDFGEDLLQVRREVREHLLGEVLGDFRGAAGEGVEQRRALRLRLQPEARELQRDRPALRALEDAVELVLRELRQEALRLVAAEAQLLRADLEQFAARAQVRARQRREIAAAEDEAHVGRRLVHQAREHVLHGVAAEAMQVVEEDDDGLRRRLQRRGECGEHGAQRHVGETLRGEAVEAADVDAGALEARDHQREEVRRFHRVRAEPDHAAARLAQLRVPAREQPGLAVAGGRVEQHQAPAALRPQQVQQHRALRQLDAEGRRRRVVLEAGGLLGHGVVESTERGV